MNFFDYKIPKRKKWLLTDKFLTTFKKELDNTFKVYEGEKNPTYWNTYNWLEGSSGFYEALKNASEKHNVKKAIYEYARKMHYYDSDSFDAELTTLMYEKGVIEEGNLEFINENYGVSEETLIEMEQNGEIEWVEEITHFNGYYITRKDWQYVSHTNPK